MDGFGMIQPYFIFHLYIRIWYIYTYNYYMALSSNSDYHYCSQLFVVLQYNVISLDWKSNREESHNFQSSKKQTRSIYCTLIWFRTYSLSLPFRISELLGFYSFRPLFLNPSHLRKEKNLKRLQKSFQKRCCPCLVHYITIVSLELIKCWYLE